MQIRRCKGSCRSGAAGAHVDQALQGLMQIRRCRGSCKSVAAGAHADQAMHEHQHEAYVSDLSLRVGGIGRQAFEFLQEAILHPKSLRKLPLMKLIPLKLIEILPIHRVTTFKERVVMLFKRNWSQMHPM